VAVLVEEEAMQVDARPWPDDRPLSLTDEHGLLLRQVAARAEELLAVTSVGGWPGRELEALVTYLRVEVLRQAHDEERLLFPAGTSSPALERLGRDHTVLHLLTETLAAAAGERPRVPAELAATTRELVAHLERHLSDEEAVLADEDERGGTPGCGGL
jgi:iron-sulfur cluster repair protein YtfE (RIC family)